MKLLLVVVAITMTSAVAPCARSEQIQPSQIFIVSGDTIEVYRRRAAVTLVGFKAPETRPVRARCAAERKAGAKVAQRARDLVAAGGLDYEDRKCACPLGAQGTSRCNLGRGCGVLTVNGRDLGQVLIDENLAVPYLCAETSCPPPPNPWCAPLPPASGR